MTLIEVLVSIGILAVLFSLSASGLSKARALAREAVCLSRARGMAQLAHLYASDFKELFPVHFASAPPDDDPEASAGRYLLYNQASLYLPGFLGWSSLAPDAPSASCPSNQMLAQRLGPGPPYSCDYLVTLAIYVDPKVLPLDPGTPPRLGDQPQRLSSVAFPAAKASVYEGLVWHAWPYSLAPFVDAHQIEHNNTVGRISCVFFDGHAGSHRPKEFLPGVHLGGIYYPPYILAATRGGVLGRDLP